MVSSISGSVSSWTSTLFSQLDTSNKGYISESDLSSAFSLLDSNASDASTSASKLFSSLDNNNNGKVTEDELASTLQALSDQLNSQYDASRMASAMGHGMPPPPPAEGNQDDAGLTEDELTSIASTTTDSKLASLMSNAASNFSAADTNGDGKVSGAEAMAYKESTEANSSSNTTTSSTTDNETMKRILALLQAYSSQGSTASSSLSLTA